VGALLSQASTKLFRSARTAHLRIEAHLERAARLLVLPDPVVAFAGSRFEQVHAYSLDEGASLLVAECLSSGRRASGEQWSFARYRSRLRIDREGRLLLLDSQLLDPTHGDLAQRFGRYHALGLVCLVGPAWSLEAEHLRGTLGASPIGTDAAVHLAASPLGADGVLIRLAAVSCEALVLEQRRLLSFVPALLGDDPWARKG
jgi:urease accessory protein